MTTYAPIVAHYESMLRQHREGPRAVDWKNAADATARYDVMLGVLGHERTNARLLDIGCGLGDLKRHIDARGLTHITYEGLDISPEFVEAAVARHPGVPIRCLDILAPEADVGTYDYAIMNGVFTRRESVGHDAMLDYLERLTARAFRAVRGGIAFNVMSPCVDYKNDVLFHPSFDDIARVVERSLSRHFVLRNDYGLYECTCYVYREPPSSPGQGCP